jgi:hypothetical protein
LGLILIIDIRELLPVVVANNKTGGQFFDGPGRREASSGDMEPNPVMTITDPLPTESYLYTVFCCALSWVSIMVSTATILLVMLAAVLMVAAIIYGEWWGHRY